MSWGRRAALTALAVALIPTLLVAFYGVVNPPVTPLMLLRWGEGERIAHRTVPLERISPHLVAAVIAAEDNRFCQHFGFDVVALQNEFDAWLDGETPRGASTISMQTAKNILLWPDRDMLRKLIEAWLTPQIEALWSKRRVVEVYLNIIEFGPGVYGAEAAAREFFGKPARDLAPGEAALLAAVLPNPRRWSAAEPSAFIQRRAQRIQRRAQAIRPLLGCVREGR